MEESHDWFPCINNGVMRSKKSNLRSSSLVEEKLSIYGTPFWVPSPHTCSAERRIGGCCRSQNPQHFYNELYTYTILRPLKSSPIVVKHAIATACSTHMHAKGRSKFDTLLVMRRREGTCPGRRVYAEGSSFNRFSPIRSGPSEVGTDHGVDTSILYITS